MLVSDVAAQSRKIEIDTVALKMPRAHAEIGSVEWLCVVESVAVFRIFILPVQVLFRDPARAVEQS